MMRIKEINYEDACKTFDIISKTENIPLSLSPSIVAIDCKNRNSETIPKYIFFEDGKNIMLYSFVYTAIPIEKFKLLDKFDDERLIGFGKKIIYQEAPEVLPKDMYQKIKSEIARRILSEKKEKWWTVKECYFEIDNLRNKYSEENDEDKLKFLDQFNDFVMSIQKKYENT